MTSKITRNRELTCPKCGNSIYIYDKETTCYCNNCKNDFSVKIIDDEFSLLPVNVKNDSKSRINFNIIILIVIIIANLLLFLFAYFYIKNNDNINHHDSHEVHTIHDNEVHTIK